MRVEKTQIGNHPRGLKLTGKFPAACRRCTVNRRGRATAGAPKLHNVPGLGEHLLGLTHRIGEGQTGQTILILCIGVSDVRFCFLEFGLAEFDDGTEAKVVTRLREV